MLAAAPRAELFAQPRGRMRLLCGLCLGQKLAGLQGVTAPRHGRQSQVGDHRVQPHERPTRGPCPVPADLRARCAPDVIVGHLREHRGRRPPHHGEAVPHQLGSGNPGQDAVDQHAVGPRRMPCAQVSQSVHIDVDASQVQALSDVVVQVAVQASQDFLPWRADRSPGQRDEIQVADAGDIVPGREGTGRHQVGHPFQGRQAIREMTHRRWYVPHPGQPNVRAPGQRAP